jgi:hypothetical protein
MKNFNKLFLKSTLFLSAIFLMTICAISQQTGSFDKTIDLGGFSRNISFYVPSGGAPTKGFPLIIGMHPAGSPGSLMREMLTNSAQQIGGAILACPDGPDGDGAAIMPLIDYVKQTYKVDNAKVILTGYSAGGYPTFQIGLNNVSTFKGLIGIAPAVSTYGVNLNAAKEVGIAIIVGTADGMYSGIKTFMDAVIAAGGNTKFVEKQGVGHTGQYFWGLDFTTDWVDCYNFCINMVLKPKQVTLSQPLNNSNDLPLATTLSWLPLNEATSYKIEIYTSQGIFKRDNATKTTYTPSGLKRNTKYLWTVRGVNDGGDGPWSSTWSFTTIPDVPKESPMLTEPADGSQLKAPATTFKWEHVSNSTKYHFQLYDNISLELVKEDSLNYTSGSSVQYKFYDLQADKQYKWKVRGFNSQGYGPWSSEWVFNTFPNPPSDMANLQEPADKTTNLPIDVTLKWYKVTGGENYHVQVKNKSDNSYFYNDTIMPKPSTKEIIDYTLNGLEYNTTYSWRISAINGGGEGPWSNEFAFTTAENVSVEEILPAYFHSTIYPNPADENISVKFSTKTPGDVKIELFYSSGIKAAVLYDNESMAGDYMLNFDLSGYPSGAYFIKIISGNKAEITTFVISK